MSSGVDVRHIKSGKKKKNTSEKDVLAFLNKDISFGNDFGAKKKEAFYGELSILLSAGIDIRTALDVVEQEQKSGKSKKMLSEIKLEIIRGASFSEVLATKSYFTPYEYQTIKIGEETGQLAHVLNELAKHYKKIIKQKRQIVNALSYPIIVLAVAFGAVGFMVGAIVPMFADIFKRFDSELPGVTQFVISISQSFLKNYPYGIGAILLIIVVWYFIRRMEWYLKYSSWVLLRLPFIGTIVEKVQLSRLSATMALLLNSKTPLLQAISLIQEMMTFYPIKSSLKEIEVEIVQGKPLSDCLENYAVYPKRMVSLVRVGEQVNKTEDFFRKIADQYNEEVEHQTSILGNLLEPILLIFLGGVIGVILVAMYLPLFKLSSAMDF